MTSEEILVIPPGHELDKLIADEVIGLVDVWLVGKDFKYPKYSTDIKLAWEVVEKLRKKGRIVVMNDTGAQYRARFMEVHEYIEKWAINPNDGLTVWCESAPEAICKAALLAMM